MMFRTLTLALISGLLLSACELGPSDETIRAQQAIDDRLLDATRAGLAEARMRQIEVPADSELPTVARGKDGQLHPIVKEWAFDGDGKLRGTGASMSALKSNLDQQIRYDDERGFMCRLGPKFCAR